MFVQCRQPAIWERIGSLGVKTAARTKRSGGHASTGFRASRWFFKTARSPISTWEPRLTATVSRSKGSRSAERVAIALINDGGVPILGDTRWWTPRLDLRPRPGREPAYSSKQPVRIGPSGLRQSSVGRKPVLVDENGLLPLTLSGGKVDRRSLESRGQWKGTHISFPMMRACASLTANASAFRSPRPGDEKRDAAWNGSAAIQASNGLARRCRRAATAARRLYCGCSAAKCAVEKIA